MSQTVYSARYEGHVLSFPRGIGSDDIGPALDRVAEFLQVDEAKFLVFGSEYRQEGDVSDYEMSLLANYAYVMRGRWEPIRNIIGQLQTHTENDDVLWDMCGHLNAWENSIRRTLEDGWEDADQPSPQFKAVMREFSINYDYAWELFTEGCLRMVFGAHPHQIHLGL